MSQPAAERSASPSSTSPPRPEAQQPPSVDGAAGSMALPRQRSPSPRASGVLSPSGKRALSSSSTDRVFPIRSVVTVEPTPTPTQRSQGDYFHPHSRANDARIMGGDRRQSVSSSASQSSVASQRAFAQRYPNAAQPNSEGKKEASEPRRRANMQLPYQLFNDISSAQSADSGVDSQTPSLAGRAPSIAGGASIESTGSSIGDMGGLITHRFQHAMTDEGHAVITGRDGDVLQRCEDEPIHIPGAVQGFGLLVVLHEDAAGNLPVRIVSENSKRVLNRSPRELFALESFTDILSEEQADNLLDHIDFIKDEDANVGTNGPEVFTMSVKIPGSRSRKLWCAMHMSDANPELIVCEFELEDDPSYPLVPPSELTPELPEDTLDARPTAEEYKDSTEIQSRPLRILRSARKRKGEAAAMEVFNIMSQVQEQLAAAPNLEKFLKVLVGVVKELTGFHRVMVYQFDHTFNGRVVTELVDPRATKDLYKGLNFPASDIPKQARDLYKVNKVRMLYDRDLETARLVCRTVEDLTNPLDLTHSYLRAMSPIHLKYLANMAVRSSMSISINTFGELWGLIACHAYGPRGMRVSFPIRKMCRLIGDSASRNIERLSYASRLQARKLINTVATEHNPSGYIIASSDDLLKLFDADFGLLSIQDETKILGQMDQSQESLAMLEYLRMRKITSVLTSTDVSTDFPDLRYPPGFHTIAGMLVVPLSGGGDDFIVFFRKGQLQEVKWAGNPYEKYVKEGTEGYLEPRKSFKTWRETIVGKCREWTEEEAETAAVLCLVYGKFIEVWRQKEAALHSSQLTRLLLANSAHEVRTPLNAIINYLEIALEGSLDQEIRDNLAKSHSASKSLIYVINDLLDLTKTEEGASLIKGEAFDLRETLREATEMFQGDAKRKGLSYDIIEHPGLPQHCIGDQRRVRQAISNIAANAFQNTTKGGITVEMYVASWTSKDHVGVEVAITDTGVGMSAQTLDRLFNELEQVQLESAAMLEDVLIPEQSQLSERGEKNVLGLGLALVARIVKNMNGQLRLKSEEGKGSRFVIQFPFNIPDAEIATHGPKSPEAMSTPQLDVSSPAPAEGERTLVAPGLTRNDSTAGDSPLSRKGSLDSLSSKKSLPSIRSGSSVRSQRSDVDRLIDAISEPHLLDKRAGGKGGSLRSRPSLSKRNSLDPTMSSPTRMRSKSLEVADREAALPPHQRSMQISSPGEGALPSTGVPLTAIKIPDEGGMPDDLRRPHTGILGELNPNEESAPTSASEQLFPEHMRVLVAEDDPVNSRIIKKRLEKLGHLVHLTVNGEECSSAFGDNPQEVDVILMDMQMPIVDGLTSTKMIRSFEKTHKNILNPRAALCGRVPIIAVSASLIEKSRQMYIDAGFDAWILKPVSFNRLSELMTAIVDSEVRNECLYQPGEWEKGGWFHAGLASARDVSTVPSEAIPQSGPTNAAREAATSDDPMAGEKHKGGTIPDEQERLLQNEAKDIQPPSAPLEDEDKTPMPTPGED